MGRREEVREVHIHTSRQALKLPFYLVFLYHCLFDGWFCVFFIPAMSGLVGVGMLVLSMCEAKPER